MREMLNAGDDSVDDPRSAPGFLPNRNRLVTEADRQERRRRLFEGLQRVAEDPDVDALP